MSADIKTLRQELRTASCIFSERGLNVSNRWALELLAGIARRVGSGTFNGTTTTPSSSTSASIIAVPFCTYTTPSFDKGESDEDDNEEEVNDEENQDFDEGNDDTDDGDNGPEDKQHHTDQSTTRRRRRTRTRTNAAAAAATTAATTTTSDGLLSDSSHLTRGSHHRDLYKLAKAYFDHKEFARCAHVLDARYANNNTTTTTNTTTRMKMTKGKPYYPSSSSSHSSSASTTTIYPPKQFFLRCYALFLEGETKKQMDRVQGDSSGSSVPHSSNNNNSANKTGGGVGGDTSLLYRAGSSSYNNKVPVNPHLLSLAADLSARPDVFVVKHGTSEESSLFRSQEPITSSLLYGNNESRSGNSGSSSRDPLFTIDSMERDSTHHHPLPSSSSRSSPTSRIDPFLTYLYGVVLRELDRKREARYALFKAASLYPPFWSAWVDLATVLEGGKPDVDALSPLLPTHWVAHLFRAHAFAEVHAHAAALRTLQPLSAVFPHAESLKAIVAKALYNLRRFDAAAGLFQDIRTKDPHRVEDADTYSNILYVKGDTAALAALAHEVHTLGKFTPQACCVIGNYFSARREHERAVLYFRRSLRADPSYTGAWTLMGHEYLEMKNTPAAIECYRRAVDANSRDYRAWYGLGQTYELLQMFLYAAYYYRRAAALRPSDSRMWCALGACFESLERRGDAVAAYERAARLAGANHSSGGGGGSSEGSASDGNSCLKLAKLYRSAGNTAQATKWYAAYLETIDRSSSGGNSNGDGGGGNSSNTSEGGNGGGDSGGLAVAGGPDTVEALLYLTRTAKDEGRYDDAETFAQRMLALPLTVQVREARSLLEEIRALRLMAASDAASAAAHASGGGSGSGGVVVVGARGGGLQHQHRSVSMMMPAATSLSSTSFSPSSTSTSGLMFSPLAAAAAIGAGLAPTPIAMQTSTMMPAEHGAVTGGNNNGRRGVGTRPASAYGVRNSSASIGATGLTSMPGMMILNSTSHGASFSSEMSQGSGNNNNSSSNNNSSNNNNTTAINLASPSIHLSFASSEASTGGGGGGGGSSNNSGSATMLFQGSNNSIMLSPGESAAQYQYQQQQELRRQQTGGEEEEEEQDLGLMGDMSVEFKD